jgi:FMN phosphatase YigB (HAD superfamily)
MILIVDFDGTLFKNDFFIEILFKNFLERPIFMLNLFFKTNLNILEIKIALLSNYQINYDVNYLMSPIVLNWIENNKNRFTHIYLVSASPDFFIKKVLKNQQLFDDIYGSVEINLKGVQKYKFIQEKWGSNFTYIGDSNDDIPIFKVAKEAYKIVNNKIINVKPIYQVN